MPRRSKTPLFEIIQKSQEEQRRRDQKQREKAARERAKLDRAGIQQTAAKLAHDTEFQKHGTRGPRPGKLQQVLAIFRPAAPADGDAPAKKKPAPPARVSRQAVVRREVEKPVAPTASPPARDASDSFDPTARVTADSIRLSNAARRLPIEPVVSDDTLGADDDQIYDPTVQAQASADSVVPAEPPTPPTPPAKPKREGPHPAALAVAGAWGAARESAGKLGRRVAGLRATTPDGRPNLALLAPVAAAAVLLLAWLGLSVLGGDPAEPVAQDDTIPVNPDVVALVGSDGNLGPQSLGSDDRPTPPTPSAGTLANLDTRTESRPVETLSRPPRRVGEMYMVIQSYGRETEREQAEEARRLLSAEGVDTTLEVGYDGKFSDNYLTLVGTRAFPRGSMGTPEHEEYLNAILNAAEAGRKLRSGFKRFDPALYTYQGS